MKNFFNSSTTAVLLNTFIFSFYLTNLITLGFSGISLFLVILSTLAVLINLPFAIMDDIKKQIDPIIKDIIFRDLTNELSLEIKDQIANKVSLETKLKEIKFI